ncbi:MAG: branched-chain amino acid ABC transporter permease [Thermoflexales bacterium]
MAQTSTATSRTLSGVEVLALALGVFLSVVLGGWSSVIIAGMVGLLLGFAAQPASAGVRRNVVSGLLFGVAVALSAAFHNNVIVQLPGQEQIPAAANSAPAYLAAVVMTWLPAVGVVWMRAQQSSWLRVYGPLAVVLLLAVAFPLYTELTGLSILWTSVIIVALIYAMQAMGLNIVAGYAGMLDLGYVAFFAIGAYVAGLLMSPHLIPERAAQWSFWIVIWVGAAVAALFGVLLGAPVIPLRGDYLAIVTLGFGEIIPIVFKNLEAIRIYEPISEIIAAVSGDPSRANCLVGCETPFNFTNGVLGINPISRPVLFGYEFQTGQYLPWYYLILALVLVTMFFVNRLRHSRIGRAWVAVREDELAAAAMGVPVIRTRLAAFLVGAMFSGFAGVFYGSYVSFISPDAFDFSISVIVLCMVILGGSGNLIGVVIGALVIKIADLLLLDRLQAVLSGLFRVTIFQWNQDPGLERFFESLFNMTQYKLLLFGLILVVMMLARPRGLLPENIVTYSTKEG